MYNHSEDLPVILFNVRDLQNLRKHCP